MKETVYISFKRNSQVDTRKVNIGQTASVWCTDEHIMAKVKAMTIVNVPQVKSRRYVFSVMKIVESITKEFDNVDVVNIGCSEFIVSYREPRKTYPAIQWVKIVLVCVLVFCGGAFAIMAYGNDVDINRIFSVINDFTAGGDDVSLFILQISYSIGLTAGIIIFYNHIGRKKYKKDPTPLDVEMRLYEDEINTAVVNDSIKEGRIEDVD